MPLPITAPGGISWSSFVRQKREITLGENHSKSKEAEEKATAIRKDPLTCTAAVCVSRSTAFQRDEYIIPDHLKPSRLITRATTAPSRISPERRRSKIRNKQKNDLTYRAWVEKKNKDCRNAKKMERKAAKVAERKKRAADRAKELRRQKIVNDSKIRKINKKNSRIAFLNQSNRQNHVHGTGKQPPKSTSAAQYKLRELQSMEWHLQKDLEAERKRIQTYVYEESVRERVLQERKNKWVMKPVKLCYSIRN